MKTQIWERLCQILLWNIVHTMPFSIVTKFRKEVCSVSCLN
jgi:hypothetical protein